MPARQACGVIATFAAALQKDATVKSALSSSWSNAQCEGQITRLKLLERQMYGCARLDLLQRSVLLTVWSSTKYRRAGIFNDHNGAKKSVIRREMLGHHDLASY